VPSGLLAWYPLDEHAGATTVLDISGNGHNGTPHPAAVGSGGPMPNVPSPPAVVGGSLYFPSNQTYVQVPSSPPALDIGSGDFTLDAWVYAVNAVAPIVDKFDAHAHTGYKFYLDAPFSASNTSLYFSYGDGSVNLTAKSAAPVPLLQWHHVAVTVQRSSTSPYVTVLFYVDGTPHGGQSVVVPVGNIANGLPLLIGGFSMASAAATEIALDELEIFKVALSAGDIAAIYGAGGIGKCKPTLTCVGDCRGAKDVTVDDLVTMVNIALDRAPSSACSAGDANQDGMITIDELLTAVNNALNGCPAD
jgi:hypothetical protein